MKGATKVLSEDDKAALQNLINRPRTPQALALRARIVLATCEKRTNHAVARELGVSLHTVGKWLRRYAQSGVDGLKDLPRSGKPRRFPREDLEALIRQTMQTPRPEGKRWTVRSVAQVVGISSATIGRAWQELLRRRAFEPAQSELPSAAHRPAPTAPHGLSGEAIGLASLGRPAAAAPAPASS